MTLNPDLCVDHHGRENVPFKYFVRPTILPSSKVSTSFTCFPQLPVELQLQIYDFCDGSTLFNLMHTCSDIRKEASKRFWTHKDTWYRCSEDTAFPRDTQHPIIQYCPDFASRITQVEIDFIRIHMAFPTDEIDPIQGPRTTTSDKARAFWARVQSIFPSVRTLVMTGLRSYEGFPLLPSDSEYETSASVIETVIGYAPSNIRVLVAQEYWRTPNRAEQIVCDLWRVDPDSKSPWQLIQSSWTIRRILLPKRHCPAFPVGTMLEILASNRPSALEQWGLQRLRLESYRRYSPPGSPWRCVASSYDTDCDATFADQNDWEEHIYNNAHQHHGFSKDRLHLFRLCEHTPSEEKTAIEARCKRFTEDCEEIIALRHKIRDAYGPYDSEERRLFLENLYSDEQPARPAPGECVEEKCTDKCTWLELLAHWFRPERSEYE
ncbi:hypothetical protein HBI69_129670 [Parastagonospora nodorum]|nr:hypothetical protein HBI69_129670 [Parastagonospora nodorum]